MENKENSENNMGMGEQSEKLQQDSTLLREKWAKNDLTESEKASLYDVDEKISDIREQSKESSDNKSQDILTDSVKEKPISSEEQIVHLDKDKLESGETDETSAAKKKADEILKQKQQLLESQMVEQLEFQDELIENCTNLDEIKKVILKYGGLVRKENSDKGEFNKWYSAQDLFITIDKAFENGDIKRIHRISGLRDKIESFHIIGPTQPKNGEAKEPLVNESRQENIDLKNENADIKNKFAILEQKYEQAQIQIKELTEKVDKLLEKIDLLSQNTPEKTSNKEEVEQPVSKPQPKEQFSKNTDPTQARMKVEDRIGDATEDTQAKEAYKEWLKSHKTPEEQKSLIEKSDVHIKGGMRIPSFDPNEFFKTPTIEDFDPNKPFEETSTGTQLKSQLVHNMYRRGYGTRPIKGERTRTAEETVEDFQNEEERVLGEYYGKLIKSAEAAGLDINNPATTKVIRESMVTAKRSLERHLVNNYGNKVNQERRSNWWLRLINFLNSDIAERKTIGEASDIVAMNGGDTEDAYAAIKNMVNENENGEKDYSAIISRMNAHTRRAIKKSLDFSNHSGKFISPDNKSYDRYQTYALLQQVYCEGMADEAKIALAEEKKKNGDKAISPDRMLARILIMQNERLMTIEKDVSKKRWSDVWNKLKAAAIGGAIGMAIWAIALGGANDKDVKKRVEDPSKPKPTKIEKVDDTNIEKDNQPATPAIEDKDSKQPPQPKPDSKIINVKIGDKDVDLEVNPTNGDVTEIGSDTQKIHRAASKIQVSATEKHPDSGSLFIPDATRINDLERFIDEFSQLDKDSQIRMDKYIHENKSGYGALGAEIGPDQSAINWAKSRIEELQKNLKIEDIDNTI